MKNFGTVLGFHLKEGLSSKAFKITVFILLAAILCFFGFTHFVDNDDKTEVLLLNNSPEYKLDINQLNKTYEHANFESITTDKLESSKTDVKDGEKDALIVISANSGVPTIDYYFKRIPDMELSMSLQASIKQQYLNHVISEKNVDPQVAQALLTDIPVKNEALKDSESLGLVYFFIFLMYMFIIMFGQQVSMSIAGEKTTRVMEIMITKVSAITMMYAKILSSLILGIIQISMVAVGYLVANLLGWTSNDLSLFGLPLDLSVLNAKIFVFLVLFFALGYILYALIFAAISSTINRIEDIGSIIFPVSILLMSAFFLGMKAMMDPNATIVLVGSYIPFFSPIVTFTRFVLEEASYLEIGLSIAILVATIAFLSVFANRVYRNGVMRYSGKTSIADVIKLGKNE